MLRLSVTKNEYLMVGKDVRITFLGGNGTTLRLMIDAPKEINLARGKADFPLVYSASITILYWFYSADDCFAARATFCIDCCMVSVLVV